MKFGLGFGLLTSRLLHLGPSRLPLPRLSAQYHVPKHHRRFFLVTAHMESPPAATSQAPVPGTASASGAAATAASAAASAAAQRPARPRSPRFPPHNAPRVWFLTNGTSPISIALATQILEHGDYVVAGVLPAEFERESGRSDEFRDFLDRVGSAEGDKERWKGRLRVVGLDAR